MSYDFDDYSKEEVNDTAEQEETSPEYYAETMFHDAPINIGIDFEEIEYQQKLQNQQAEFEELFSDPQNQVKKITSDEITVSSDAAKEAEEVNKEFYSNVNKVIIDSHEWIKDLQDEATELINRISDDKTPRREYKNEAVYPKANFSKPRTEQTPKKTVQILLIAGSILGLFLGTQGNNYYEYMNGKVDSAFSCVFNSLLVENIPMASSFQSNIFFTGLFMGFVIVAAVYGIIYLESSTNKASRVGHEHGSAHLAKSSDYKTFKNKFMDVKGDK